MESLPPEVVHIICAELTIQDAASLRLVNHKLAGVAAQYLVRRVRCHSTLESLQRLQAIANHAIFSKTVKTVVYEGSTIANIGCVHAYTSHFEDEPHHAMEKPSKPSHNATPREVRLYQRNKAKFDQDILSKYQNYRGKFDAQQQLLGSKDLQALIGSSVAKFSGLTAVEYSPIRRCSHLTSKRFNEDFGTTCAVPMTSDPLHSFAIVNHMLLGAGSISTSLKSIQVEHLSPKFFSGSVSRKSIIAVFQNLVSITLSIKPSSQDMMGENEMPTDAIRRLLAGGNLRAALAAATHLRELEIEFVIPASTLVSDKLVFADEVSWPDLKMLSLLSISTTQDRFMALLKRQPCLENLRLLFVEFTEGKWAETLDVMKKSLSLRWFHVDGFVSESGAYYPMDLIYEPLYEDEHLAMSLSEAIDDYVTSNYIEDAPNPLGAEFTMYQDEDYLFETYGSPPSDLFSSEDDSILSDMDLDYDSDADDLMSDAEGVIGTLQHI